MSGEGNSFLYTTKQSISKALEIESCKFSQQ